MDYLLSLNTVLHGIMFWPAYLSVFVGTIITGQTQVMWRIDLHEKLNMLVDNVPG